MRVRGLKRYILHNTYLWTAGSHPVRVRGLKRFQAPSPICGQKSHPVRVRGLKQAYVALLTTGATESHPVRVRGLKPAMLYWYQRSCSVAPRAGAWVET